MTYHTTRKRIDEITHHCGVVLYLVFALPDYTDAQTRINIKQINICD